MSDSSREVDRVSRRIAKISDDTFQLAVRFYCKRGDHYLNKTELLFDVMGRPRCPTHKRGVQRKTDKRINRNVAITSSRRIGKFPLCFKSPSNCLEQYIIGIEGKPRIFCMAEEPCWRQTK